MVINDRKEFEAGGGGCEVVLKLVREVMLMWELSALTPNEQCWLEHPQSLPSCISLRGGRTEVLGAEVL